MLQTKLLFLHTADADKNYNRELKLSLEMYDLYFMIVSVICLLVTLLGLIGNGIVFWLLCCTIKKTKFTIYVANLAIGDFIAILHSFISFLEYFSPSIKNRLTRQLMVIMFFFGHETSSYFLTAICTERCLAVFSPVWYQSHRQKCPTAIICALLWTLPVIQSVLDYFLCSFKYILTFNISPFPCQVITMLRRIVVYAIFTPVMIVSTSAIFIRIKMKPQQNLPARLDISILAIIVLHVILDPAVEILSWIFSYVQFRYQIEYYYFYLVFYCLTSTINPFVYFLVGMWKRESGQEPFCMFLERALRYERNGRMRTQPDQEQT